MRHRAGCEGVRATRIRLPAHGGLPFETNRPGVFAIGDIRSGSIKRVAAAVGEGAQVVATLHDYLAPVRVRRSAGCRNRRRRLDGYAGLQARAEASRDVTPSALGCEECLKIGIALGAFAAVSDLRSRRLLRQLAAPARDPSTSTPPAHPIIEGYDPPEGWGWCYVDDVWLDLSDRMTPHNGPIPRYV